MSSAPRVPPSGFFVSGSLKCCTDLLQPHSRLLIALQPFRLLESGLESVERQFVIPKRPDSFDRLHHRLISEGREVF